MSEDPQAREMILEHIKECERYRREMRSFMMGMMRAAIIGLLATVIGLVAYIFVSATEGKDPPRSSLPQWETPYPGGLR